MSQHVGEYPLQAYMVVGGRYIEGSINCPSDTTRFLALSGGHLPADLQVRHFPPEVIPLRRQLMTRA